MSSEPTVEELKARIIELESEKDTTKQTAQDAFDELATLDRREKGPLVKSLWNDSRGFLAKDALEKQPKLKEKKTN
jgi:hypothetical protein